jgi:hypothetical protein
VKPIVVSVTAGTAAAAYSSRCSCRRHLDFLLLNRCRSNCRKGNTERSDNIR